MNQKLVTAIAKGIAKGKEHLTPERIQAYVEHGTYTRFSIQEITAAMEAAGFVLESRRPERGRTYKAFEASAVFDITLSGRRGLLL